MNQGLHWVLTKQWNTHTQTYTLLTVIDTTPNIWNNDHVKATLHQWSFVFYRPTLQNSVSSALCDSGLLLNIFRQLEKACVSEQWPKLLWCFGDYGAIYKYHDLLTYTPTLSNKLIIQSTGHKWVIKRQDNFLRCNAKLQTRITYALPYNRWCNNINKRCRIN